MAKNAVAWHSEIAARFEDGYKRSPLFRERLAVWGGQIERFSVNGGKVLDAGCGPGILSAIAARTAGSVLGFDASPEMVALAQKRIDEAQLGNTAIRLASLGDGQVLAGQSFDLVMCSSVLEYVDNFDEALDWLCAALKPGGVLLLSMPNGASLYRMAERIAFKVAGRPTYYAHVRTVPLLSEVEAKLRRHGGSIEAVSYYAAVPVLSAAARAVGIAHRMDTLFVVAFRKTP